MKTFFAEPLVWFLILGGVLFGVERVWQRERSPRRVVVPKEQQETLTEAQLSSYLEAEMLYREALFLGLDKGDVIVRRRMIQKMEFVAEQGAHLGEVSEADLQRYFVEHRTGYGKPELYSFDHVFVSVDGNGAQRSEGEARRLAETIGGHLRDRGIGPDGVGTLEIAKVASPFLRGTRFVLRSKEEVSAIFGGDLASALGGLPLATWSGPYRSSYGWHLVWLAERRASMPAEYAEVSEQVRRDYEGSLRERARKEFVADLKKRYEVVVVGK